MSARTADDRQRTASDIGSGFLWSTGLIALGAISWFGLHRAAPAILMIGVGIIVGALTLAVSKNSAEVLGSLLVVPALVGAGWLFIKLLSSLWPAALLAGIAFIAVATSRKKSIASMTFSKGHQLRLLHQSLTGRRTDFDDVLISRGLLFRLNDGTVQRPSKVEARPGNNIDTVRFRPLPGTAMAWKAAMGELPHLFGVELLLSSPQPGVLDLSHRHTEAAPAVDPLHGSLVLARPVPPVDWSLRVGVAEGGFWVDVPLANRAGVVVGGQPGSGKTGSLRSMLAAWASLPHVQLAVVDGKGGSDWNPLATRCFEYISTVDDLEAVIALLRSLESERARRVATMMNRRGSSNFWDLGPGVDMPLIVLCIDEVQAFVSKAYHASKGARELVDEIIGLLMRLVSQGRSAGLVCILATQKPTADNLPTSLRDSAGIKLCYSVPTRQAAEAVLGDAWSAAESPVTPVAAPQGLAVFADGMGHLARIRSPFVPDGAVAEWCSLYASLVADPRRGGQDQ